MKTLIKKLYRFFLKKTIIKIHLLYCQTGSNKKCYICNREIRRFLKLRGGWKNVPIMIKNTEMVGSDVENFRCPFCSAHDRERHIFMFFDKLNLWEKMKDANIIHFAPDGYLYKKIETCLPLKYVKADLFPWDNSIEKIDATEIPYPDSTFDFLIFNHILEHIPDYLKALKEIYRVLKPNGIAILQTPYSKLFRANFEDEGINTEKLRLFFYGQIDHVRIFSERQFIKDLKETGFILEIIKHEDFFSDQDSLYFGVNKQEDLIKVRKPGNE
jgi:SAM-dependent methyltransferase